MIKRIFKWMGIIIGSLLVLAFIGYGIASYAVSDRVSKRYAFTAEDLNIPADSAAIAHGEHLARIKGCIDCHGAGLSGHTMADDAMLGRISASNLTKGVGGLLPDYSTRDWLMVLRHGITKDGRPLLFMPSQETSVLSGEDLAALIAYCRQLPLVNNSLPENKLGPVARILAAMDKLPLLSVEKIDHKAPIAAAVDTTEGVALGRYLSISCTSCHRANMKGGDALAPGGPHVPDITSAGNPGHWSRDQFLQTLRTGKTPAGHLLNNEEMPWKMTAAYTDKELSSLYKYLISIK